MGDRHGDQVINRGTRKSPNGQLELIKNAQVFEYTQFQRVRQLKISNQRLDRAL